MKHLSSLMRGGPAAGLLLTLLWLAGPAARAQAPAWQMAVAVNQTLGTSSEVQAMVADANGNVFVAGNFTGTTSFGNIDLTSVGGSDIFIARWSPVTGSFTWAQRAGGTANDYAGAIAVSGGGIYVAGQFQSATADFGSSSLQNAGPANTDDVFVSKLTDVGGFVWTQRAGGTGIDAAAAMCVAASEVYIAGTFSSLAIGFGNTMLTNADNTGTYDAFVTKLTDAGSTAGFVWAKRAGGAESDFVTTMAVTGTNVYIAGDFRSPTASFDALTLSNTTASPPFTDDVFVAKLTDGGTNSTFNWVQRAGGSGYDDAYALTTAGATVYLAGSFGFSNGGPANATATFGSTTLTTAGLTDVFITKLTDSGSSGTFVWAQRAGGALFDTPKGIGVVGTNVCIVGSFGGPTADFGAFNLSNTSSMGSDDIFVAKVIDAGSSSRFAWAQQAGGPAIDDANAMAIAGTSLYVAGATTAPSTFGNLSITGPTTLKRAFLASLADPTLLATAASKETLSFTLAPNPARAATTVQLPAQPGTAATLTLRDALGRALRTATVALPPAGLRHELDLTGLPAGLYALQVRAGAATATRRLVVE
ncbi:T9SS type A sorting domain-containing protein [Hymenobacter terricola]|uniref:T9SS type A sorting domain-containing protein n=1 Tax=Hymenobacter terricola TaxID=2819236 RepID=UPI001B30A23B|nr:T9SS type A sorting domain-containing protein [Hymenobacter terricola]